MIWQKYTLTFRLLAPLHVGWRKTGNLMQTRGYVPGKNVWAALTERLTRRASQGTDGQGYVQMGKAVQDAFRFGYLYPALPCHTNKVVASANELTPYYPWQDDLFTYRFFSSYASTALNYAQQTAEDALLHETEFMRPHARPFPSGTTAPQVYLMGDLFVKQDLSHCTRLTDWPEALTQLRFGGERGYGWGRVTLIGCEKTAEIQSNQIQISLKINDYLLAHLATNQHHPAAVAGPVEPLTGWERDNQSGRHWRLAQAQICYAPGSKVTTDSTFQIGPNGIWEH